MRRISKTIISLLALCIFVTSLPLQLVQATSTIISEAEILKLENVSGAYRHPNDPVKFVESDEDLNYTLENLILEFENNTLKLETEIEGQEVLFNVNLYPSQLGYHIENKIIGIEEDNIHPVYQIVKLNIENDTKEESLLIPNMNMAGNVVINLGIYNKITQEIYLLQHVLENFDFNKIFATVVHLYDETRLSPDEIVDVEAAYFSLQPIESFKRSFKEIETMSYEGESFEAHIKDLHNTNPNTSISFEDEAYDDIIEHLNKASINNVNRNTRVLIPDIPDSLYATQANGQWSVGETAWDTNSSANTVSGTKIGFIMYHMNDPFSGNVMNYVLRYYVLGRTNFSAEEVDVSFYLSHNVWVQYYRHNNSSVIFDDRPSNARLRIDPMIFAAVTNSQGHFNERQKSAYKEGSIARQVALVAISNLPYLGQFTDFFNSGQSIETNRWTGFERTSTRQVSAEILDLRYAPNERGYAQDYIRMTIKGTNLQETAIDFNWLVKIR